MNISTHKTQSTLFQTLDGTHTSETVNPTSYTHQHRHSQVKHFQQIRKVLLIKFNPDRQNAYTRTSLFRPVLSHKQHTKTLTLKKKKKKKKSKLNMLISICFLTLGQLFVWWAVCVFAGRLTPSQTCFLLFSPDLSFC